MIKRSPRRNPRSKGINLKHGLQICLLLGICFWLIYQVKRSHDKKRELDEKDTTLSRNAQHHNDLPKLGRKDLHPDLLDKTRSEKPEEEDTRVDDEVNKKEEKGHEKEKEEDTKHEEEEEGGFKDEEVEREEHIHEEEEREGERTDHLDKEREEEIRHEEEEQNEEAESEETKDKGRQGGNDEVDEGDQEKIEGEADRDEEFMDEEKERENEGEETESQGSEGEDNEAEEKENQGNEDEDREVQTDNETQSEDQDHDGEDNSHEAREEHYKADDASSAVTHDSQIISTEPEKEGLEKSNENLAADNLQVKYSITGNPLDVNEDKNNSISQLGLAEIGHPLNVTTVEKQNDEITPTKSEDESPNNTTATVLSRDQLVPSNKSLEVSSEAGDNQAGANLKVSGSSQQNGTLNVSDSDQVRNATIDGRVTGDVSNLQTTQWEQVNNGMVHNSIDSSNSSSNLESGLSNEIVKPELTAAEDVDSGLSSRTNESTEATRDEMSGTRNKPGRTDENTTSSNMNMTEDAIVHDPIDSSIGQDEREALIDLGTLPETDTGGVNSGNAAEE
ncbi:hypothetical protein SADUNF_Sadunf09G0067500 [Salix dunnii]|uniref:Uncharacterized protein n=1 Tax=Salix dunnii TaxID=1413687 RepID=A0A835MW84_9ROSI|nr:hypothetical protein SADUNF_Sadunf09G0067500 [Salix dunnii]